MRRTWDHLAEEKKNVVLFSVLFLPTTLEWFFFFFLLKNPFQFRFYINVIFILGLEFGRSGFRFARPADFLGFWLLIKKTFMPFLNEIPVFQKVFFFFLPLWRKRLIFYRLWETTHKTIRGRSYKNLTVYSVWLLCSQNKKNLIKFISNTRIRRKSLGEKFSYSDNKNNRTKSMI